MEGLQGLFPIPIFMGNIEISDIEIPSFEESKNNVVKVEYSELKEKIFETTSEIIQTIGYVDQPLKLNDMWFNRYDENRPFLEYHYHQNCAWTGTYFPEDANHTTVLYNPHANMMQAYYPQAIEGSPYNQERLPINGFTKGALLIHPSWMAHQVLWNGGEPSHSISFDIAYQLPIGDKEYGSYSE